MKEKLNDILEKLRIAYDATELVPASGKSLDSLAMARQAMREGYLAVKTLLEEVGGDG